MSVKAPLVTENHKAGAQKIRKIVNPEITSTWDDSWKANITPWDMGMVQPPIKEAIESSGIEWPQKGRALVPGCGSGYDVFYLASVLNFKVIGLDVSQTAVSGAKSLISHQQTPFKGEVSFEVGDFFALAPVSADERFDIMYDYSFFVAIPPSRRNEWGRKMAELIKPGGYLITLVYPINPYSEDGPPFYVRPDHYIEPLSSAFEKVLDKEPMVSSELHVGRDRLVIWKRNAD